MYKANAKGFSEKTLFELKASVELILEDLELQKFKGEKALLNILHEYLTEKSLNVNYQKAASKFLADDKLIMQEYIAFYGMPSALFESILKKDKKNHSLLRLSSEKARTNFLLSLPLVIQSYLLEYLTLNELSHYAELNHYSYKLLVFNLPITQTLERYRTTLKGYYIINIGTNLDQKIKKFLKTKNILFALGNDSISIKNLKNESNFTLSEVNSESKYYYTKNIKEKLIFVLSSPYPYIPNKSLESIFNTIDFDLLYHKLISIYTNIKDTNIFSERFKWFQLLAEQGNIFSLFNLGLMYEKGFGVVKHKEESKKLYKLAHSHKELFLHKKRTLEQFKLGEKYRLGLGGVSSDNAEAIKWYWLAADKGHLKAQIRLGWMYQKGYSVYKDYSKALKWYEKAAEQKSGCAYNQIGQMYLKGLGVSIDSEKAFQYYKQSAEKNCIFGLINCTEIYAAGIKVITNPKKIIKKLYEEIFLKGSRSLFKLGIAYFTGEEVNQDKAMGEYFLQFAIERGIQLTCDDITQLKLIGINLLNYQHSKNQTKLGKFSDKENYSPKAFIHQVVDLDKHLIINKNEFICPLTESLMKNPVVAEDGFSYEKKALKKWFSEGNTTSPVTHKKLSRLDFVLNQNLKKTIQQYLIKRLTFLKEMILKKALKKIIYPSFTLKEFHKKEVNLQDFQKQKAKFITGSYIYECKRLQNLGGFLQYEIKNQYVHVYHFLIQLEKKRLIGTLEVSFCQNSVYLNKIQVDVAYRKQGIGQQLIKLAIEYLKLNSIPCFKKCSIYESHLTEEGEHFIAACIKNGVISPSMCKFVKDFFHFFETPSEDSLIIKAQIGDLKERKPVTLFTSKKQKKESNCFLIQPGSIKTLNSSILRANTVKYSLDAPVGQQTCSPKKLAVEPVEPYIFATAKKHKA